MQITYIASCFYPLVRYFLLLDSTPTATSSAKSPVVSLQPSTAQEPGSRPPGSYPGTLPIEHRTQPPAGEDQPLPPPAYESVAAEQPSAPEVCEKECNRLEHCKAGNFRVE